MHRVALGTLIVVGALLVAPLVSGGQAPTPAAKPAAAAVNINTATADQLTALPGIGPKMATRIIEYRQRNGGFKRVEDVMQVQGVGEKNFLKLKPLITVTPPKSDKDQ
jgi:competence protein ComEA